MEIEWNTEHVFIYAKIADFLPEVRAIFRDDSYLIHLELLVKKLRDFDMKMESRRRLNAMWTRSPNRER